MTQTQFKQPKKVLIIRFSSIGDIVLTSPVIRVVKKQWSAEIHFVTKAAFGSILEANPYIDKVFSFRKKLSEITPLLKKEKYDLVIDLHRNLRSLLIKMALKKPSVSFNKLNKQKWLMTKFKINHLPDRHIVDRYLDTVKPFGIKKDNLGLDFFMPKDKSWDESNLQKYFPNFSASHSELLAIAVGAALNTKRIPIHKLSIVAQQWNGPVALLGGASEKEDGEIITRKVNKDNVINFCGSTSIFESASIIAFAQKILTPDTGMMHIAAALGTPIVSVWGNTIPAFGMAPYPENNSNNKILEVQPLNCRPCSKIGYDECPKKHFRCMNDISADQISNTLNDER